MKSNKIRSEIIEENFSISDHRFLYYGSLEWHEYVYPIVSPNDSHDRMVDYRRGNAHHSVMAACNQHM